MQVGGDEVILQEAGSAHRDYATACWMKVWEVRKDLLCVELRKAPENMDLTYVFASLRMPGARVINFFFRKYKRNLQRQAVASTGRTHLLGSRQRLSPTGAGRRPLLSPLPHPGSAPLLPVHHQEGEENCSSQSFFPLHCNGASTIWGFSDAKCKGISPILTPFLKFNGEKTNWSLNHKTTL